MEKILKGIPANFPVSARPYKDMADAMGMEEKELLENLRIMKESGVIRRVSAALSHRKTAYRYNAMVVWRVEDRDVDSVGRQLASFDEVSHCYERDTAGYWPYNLYTMVHGRSYENCMESIEKMAQTTGIGEYKILLSKREFKKSSFTVSHE